MNDGEEYKGWTPNAVSLVERSVAAHGGRELWQATASIRVPVMSASGFLLALKGYPRTFPMPREFEVFPHECVTIFHGYPRAGLSGRFASGDVIIANADGREVHAESRNHRRTFAGFAKFRRWSSLDALYFFGYALWHYHVLPFSLRHASLNRVFSRRGALHGVDVTFPEDVPTHCRRQQFYFDIEGRIVRHDYVADVIGPMARGSHYWEEYDQSCGWLVARRRRVVARIGSYATPLEVMCVDMGGPVVERR